MSIEKMDTHEIVNMYQEKFGIHFNNMNPIVTDSDYEFKNKAIFLG